MGSHVVPMGPTNFISGRTRRMSMQTVIKHVTEGAVKPLLALLEAHAVDVNLADVEGLTLLHRSAMHNRFAIAQALLNAGAKINACGGPNLETPLQFALRGKYYRLAELLYQSGADLQHKSALGYDALHNAVRENLDTQAVFLLLFWGANSNSVDEAGDTALTWVLEKSVGGAAALDIVRLLVKYDTDPSTFTGSRQDGNTPLHLFIKNSAAADPLAAFEVHQHKGMSPWISDTLSPRAEVVSTTGAGAGSAEDNAARTNADGLVPYSYATVNKHRVMQAFLWDAMFFNKLPYMFPAWVTACSTFVFYLILRSMYPLYAIVLIFACLLLLARWVLQWTIIRHRGRTMVGAYGALLAVTFLHHIAYISTSTSFTANVFFTGFFLVSVLLGIKLHGTRPTCLKPADRGVLASAVVSCAQGEGYIHGAHGTTEYRREPQYYDLPDICGACIADRRFSSMHCEECGHCVVGQSLHFPLLDVCIGEGNRRLYCGYLAITGLYFALASYLSYNMHSSTPGLCDAAEVHTDMWIGIYQIAVEFCMFHLHFGMWIPFFITLGFMMYMFGLLQFEVNLVSRETSYNLLSQQMFEYHEQEENSVHSGARQRQNLFEFIKKGSYRLRFRDACVQHNGGGDLTFNLENIVRMLNPFDKPGERSDEGGERSDLQMYTVFNNNGGDNDANGSNVDDALLEEGRSGRQYDDRVSQLLRLHIHCEQQRCDHAAEAAATAELNNRRRCENHNHDHSHGHSATSDGSSVLTSPVASVVSLQQISRD